MQVTEVPMTEHDVFKLEDYLSKSQRILRKGATYIFVFFLLSYSFQVNI
jgi:hypothetical protein